MGRFSPQVAVQDRSGELLADGIAQAFANLAHNRRQAKVAKQQEAAQQRATELEDLQLAGQGLFRGQAPVVPLQTTGGVMQASGQVSPVVPTRQRYTQVTPGFYRDQQVLDDKRASDFQSIVAEATAKAQAQRAADPEGFKLERDQKLGQIAYTDALRRQAEATAGAATNRAEAPVRGTKAYNDMLADEERIRAQFRRDPQGPTARFSPIPVMGEDGKTYTGVLNNLTGAITPTEMQRPSAARGQQGGLTPAQATEVKKKQSALLNLQKSLDALDSAVATHGVEVWPGAAKSQLEALTRDAQLQLKDAASLGALTGPDLALLEGLIRNPTSPFQFMRGGAEGAREGYKQIRAKLAREAATLKEVYGADMPAAFSGAPPAPSDAPKAVNPWRK